MSLLGDVMNMHVKAVNRLCKERDQARRIAASLEAEVAAVRAMHKPTTQSSALTPITTVCLHCDGCDWPCPTAQAVYL